MGNAKKGRAKVVCHKVVYPTQLNLRALLLTLNLEQNVMYYFLLNTYHSKLINKHTANYQHNILKYFLSLLLLLHCTFVV